MTDTTATAEAAIAPPLEAVFYTDGGCRAMGPGMAASRGFAGWGLHGYFFTREEPKTGAGAKRGVPTAMGYDNKGKGKGDITVHAYVDEMHSVPGEGTNNLAEILAACRAFELAIEHHLTRFVLRADSKLVLDGIEKFMPAWRRRQFTKQDGTPQPNQAEWRRLSDLMEQYESIGKFICSWVPGHSNDLGNDLADRYARRGVLSRREDRTLAISENTPAKGYWKSDYEKQRFLSLPNWYFSVSKEMDLRSADGRYVYYLGDIRQPEEFYGKRISDAAFAVVYLKEEEPVLSRMRQLCEIMAEGTMQGLLVADLKAIFAADIVTALTDHGDRFLMTSRQTQSIEHMDSAQLGKGDCTSLVHEIRPTRLAYAGIAEMENMEKILHEVLHPRESSRLQLTDITEVLYERTTTPASKNKAEKVTVGLSSAISPTTRYIDVEVKVLVAGVESLRKVRLTLGQDLPDRNTLAALASADVSVRVVTWAVSAQAYQFATVLESDGNSGIWTGPYANLNLVIDPPSKA